MITTNDVAATTTTVAQTPTKAEASVAAAASDFESFLSLLTAQLRNQDPLSPLDSTQFVEQLASFSAVEQQIQTNRLLEEFTGGMSNNGLENATLWIGKEVDAPTPTAAYAGEPLTFAVPRGESGATGEVSVRDSEGNVVYKTALTAGQSTFEWNGVDTMGDSVPEDEYAFSVDYTRDGEAVSTAPLGSTARISEVRLVDGAMKLVADNGALIDPADVSAVREVKASNVLAGNI